MKRQSADIAISILSWLVDMCAPDPAAVMGTRNSPELRATWLSRPRSWLPVDAKTSREPWLLADAGFIELRHLGPAVMHVTKSKVTATCYPSARLTELGARWCRLALIRDGSAKLVLVRVVEQALARPADMSAIIEAAVEQCPELADLKGQTVCPVCQERDGHHDECPEPVLVMNRP